MSEQNLQDRLEQGMYGKPQLKPDEKRKYLGNFRERVYVIVTFDECKQTSARHQLKKIMMKFPNHQLFINGQLPTELQKKLIQIAQETKSHFTVVDTSLPENKSDLAAVYAGDEPAGVSSIDLPKTEELTSNLEQKKQSFWQKLFSSK